MTSMLIRSVKSIFSSGSDEDHEAMDKVRELAERFAIEYLQRLVNNPDYPSEVVAKLMINHERALSVFDKSEATMTSEAVQDATVSIDEDSASWPPSRTWCNSRLLCVRQSNA